MKNHLLLAVSFSCALAASALAQGTPSGTRSTEAGAAIAGSDVSTAGTGSSTSAMAMMFDKWDTDHNGSISKEEFMAGMAMMHGTGTTGTGTGTTGTGNSGSGTTGTSR